MNKTSQLFILLILSFNCFAGKVAYLPVYEHPQPYAPIYVNANEMKVIDIDTKTLIKTIDFAGDISDVFVSNDSSAIYVPMRSPDRIIQLEASSLTVVKTWDSLPIPPYKIVMSPDNKHLFVTHFTGSKIFRINLANDQVDEVFDNGLPISNMLFSQSLEKLVLVANINQYHDKVTVFNVNNFIIENEFNLPTLNLNSYGFRGIEINHDATTLYAKYLNYPAELHSYDLSSGSKNWEYRSPANDMPIFFENGSEVIVSTNNKTIKLDKLNGVEISQINFYPDYPNSTKFVIRQLEGQKMLIANRDKLYCAPIGGCYASSILNLKSYDFETGSIETIFSPSTPIFGGTTVSGRFIGNNLYQPPKVPTLSLQSLLLFVFGTLFLAFQAMKKRTK